MRACQIPLRYGVSAEKVQGQLRRFAALLAKNEAVGTVPATADALLRHPKVVPDLRPFDVALHGYHHVPYGDLPAQAQARDLDTAVDAFSRLGFRPQGFRAPYLRATDRTRELLADRGLMFDSSLPYFALPSTHPLAGVASRLTTARYGRLPGSARPQRILGNFVELPVALPDDEVLVDGIGLRNPQQIRGVLLDMFGACHDTSGSLVLQVHPERFALFEEPLEAVLARASEVGAWVVSLSQLANHVRQSNGTPVRWPNGCSMALSITGDLDALSLGDFARRIRGRKGWKP